ncbi:MAG: DNA polymerase III subunit gamma and tau [Lapillicoccus sp.]
MTTALYRRYRPESFRDVIGQEHVTEPLMQALRTGRVNHAYLFSGPRGCGKTTSARILARCLNCEQGPTPEPCGVCESCVALARGGPGTVDVIEIDAASHGGVDDARDLRERASYGPAQSRFKVYIIDEAHMVTPQGFNALLKIVEEPPEHVKFVFATTEPDKVIGTIRSRTHHYPFRLVPPARLTAYMEHLCEQEQVRVAPGVLGFVTRAGGGSVRDSLSVLDQLIAGSGDEGLTYEGAAALLGFTDGELLDATIDALAAGDGASVFTQIDKVIESGHDPRRFVEDLLERLRDLIIVAAVPEGAASVLRGVPEDQLERMRGQQAHFGPGALSRAADIVNAGLTEMTGATAPRMQLELICARILLPAASGSSGYAARLDRLERRLELGGTPTAARPGAAESRAADPRRSAPPAAPTPPGSVTATDPSSPPPSGPPPPSSAVGPTSAGSPRETSASAPVEPSAAGPAARDAPSATPATPAAPTAPTANEGAVDTATLRRVWPDVLARVFTMRRFTWTFLSQHAQVVDYDGTRLVLGIATEGLTQTFRQGKHGDWVRQALIDEIGIDVPVEGIPMADAGSASAGGAGRTAPAAAAAARAEHGPSRGSGAPVVDRPERDETSRAPSSPSRGAGTGALTARSSGRPADRAPAPDSEADFGPEPPPDDEPPPPEDDGRPGRSAQGRTDTARPTTARSTTAHSAPAPPTSAPPTSAPSTDPASTPLRGTARSRGAAAAAAAAAAASPTAAGRPDDAVSDEDEDIAASGAAGRQVLERVLGAQVISETED